MGLFSKIFGGATEEGTDPASRETAAAEHAADAAAKATEASAGHPPVQPSPARVPAARKDPVRSPEATTNAATPGNGAKTEGSLATPRSNDARVAPSPLAAPPPRAAAAPDSNSSRSVVPASRRPATETAQPRPVAPQPFAMHTAPSKIAADGSAPLAVKPGLATGSRATATAARQESPRSVTPSSRAAGAGTPKSTSAVRAPGAGKQPARADAPTASVTPALGAAQAPAAATDGKKADTLDLESLPPPAMEAPAPPRAKMDSEDEVDRAFARVASIGPTPSDAAAAGTQLVDPITREHNAELFRQMAVGLSRPLRDFMLELVLGSTTKQWIEIAKRPVENLLKGARALEVSDLVEALVDFDRGLDDARNAHGSRVSGAERERLLSHYEKLTRALPMAFDLKGERDRREPIVVHQLLLQVQGVHKVAIDKLYAAGLASLDGLCRSSPDDLMALARLDREGAEGIVRRFQAYLRERTEQVLEKGETQAKQRLRALIDKLGKAHQEFQRAEADEDRARKRRARIERRTRALEMNVLLAQLGEIDLVAELERSATDRRIERVRSYIESSGRAEPMRQEAV